LRHLAPAIRAELAASGKAVDEAGFAFGAHTGAAGGFSVRTTRPDTSSTS
jgi:hypothetical protein